MTAAYKETDVTIRIRSNRYYSAEYRIAVHPTIRPRSVYEANIRYSPIINPYNFPLLSTASIDKAFLVVVMQFSIGRMIKRRQNTITVYQIDRTGYHFPNQWA